MEKDEYKLTLTKGDETILNFQVVPGKIIALLGFLKRFFAKNEEDVQKTLDKKE